MYVCMYVCMYLYIYAYIHAYLYAHYIYIYTHAYIHIRERGERRSAGGSHALTRICYTCPERPTNPPIRCVFKRCPPQLTL